MKASEMIAMLEKNPKLNFICNDQRLSIKERELRKSCGAGYHIDWLIAQDWQLVREPVPVWEAFKAWIEGKSVKCERTNCDGGYCCYGDEDNFEAGRDCKKGTWYILDEQEGGGLMTNKQKIAWLKRYTILERRLKHRFDEIERLRSMLGKITATLTDMPQGGGSIYKSKDHDIINRIADTIQLMELELDQWVDTRQEIEKVINGVQGDTYKELLSYRYLNGMDWIPIAAAMNYSWTSVHKMHSRALARVEIGGAK